MICQNLVEELEEAYTLITVVEEEMVENAKKLDLSLAEVHMLQAIGKNKEKGQDDQRVGGRALYHLVLCDHRGE